MPSSYVLGVDFGSDSVRCILADTADGSTLSECAVNYPRWSTGAYCDPSVGQYRQHPMDYIESLERAIGGCLSRRNRTPCSCSGRTTPPSSRPSKSAPAPPGDRSTTRATAAAATRANGSGRRCCTACATPPGCSRPPGRGPNTATGSARCWWATPPPSASAAAAARRATRRCGTSNGTGFPTPNSSNGSTRC